MRFRPGWLRPCSGGADALRHRRGGRDGLSGGEQRDDAVNQNRDSQTALSVARAGLQRFLGETVGQVGDSVSYAIGMGVATVTTRKVWRRTPEPPLLHRVRGQRGRRPDAADPGQADRGHVRMAPSLPRPAQGSAVGERGNHADRRAPAVSARASSVSGTDHASAGECAGALRRRSGRVVKGAGTVSRPRSGGSYTGHTRPALLFQLSGNVRHDGYPLGHPKERELSRGLRRHCALGFIASDSFPIVRYNGDLNATWTWQGQGVLIVTGTLTMNYGFYWNGIILAGALADTASFASVGPPQVNGMLIGGMNGSNANVTIASGRLLLQLLRRLGSEQVTLVPGGRGRRDLRGQRMTRSGQQRGPVRTRPGS